MVKNILRRYVVQLQDDSFVGDFDFTCRVNELYEAEHLEMDDVGRFMAHISDEKKKEVKELREIQIEYSFL